LLPGTAGVLKRVEADIGDQVKAGQILAEIDAPAAILDERLALAGVAQAEGLFKEADAHIAIARAEVAAAKGAVKVREVEVTGAKATAEFRKKSYDRLKESYARGVLDSGDLIEPERLYRVAVSQADAAAVGVENARAELLVKEAKLLQAEAGLTTTRANIESAKVGLEKARLAQAQARIVAPFDGIVSARRLGAGDFVRSGERADSTPVFTVMQTHVLRLVAWVPETFITRVAPGQTAEVQIDAFPNRKMTGTVARLGVTVETPKQAVRVEIDLPNPKGEVRPGMTATLILKLDRGPAGALRVPAGAVLEVPGAKDGEPATAVYVYKDGKARLMRVQLGLGNGKETEVMSGLSATDLVVADPKDLAPKTEVPGEIEKPAPPK
jgi:RND family efflux transporter MFP subunit